MQASLDVREIEIGAIAQISTIAVVQRATRTLLMLAKSETVSYEEFASF